MALFLSAGWGSFKHKKVPEKAILFRWFVAGLVGAGLIAYAWIFGSGGDMKDLIDKIGAASIDLNEVVKVAAASSAVLTGALKGSSEDSSEESNQEKDDLGKPRAVSGTGGELQVGMPNF